MFKALPSKEQNKEHDAQGNQDGRRLKHYIQKEPKPKVSFKKKPLLRLLKPTQ